jgi:hypothetical protein
MQLSFVEVFFRSGASVCFLVVDNYNVNFQKKQIYRSVSRAAYKNIDKGTILTYICVIYIEGIHYEYSDRY